MKKTFFILAIMTLSFSSFAQTGTVNVAGTIMDEQGETLIGVSVQVKGTGTGVVTDYEGRFRIENVPAGSTLVYSYLG